MKKAIGRACDSCTDCLVTTGRSGMDFPEYLKQQLAWEEKKKTTKFHRIAFNDEKTIMERFGVPASMLPLLGVKAHTLETVDGKKVQGFLVHRGGTTGTSGPGLQ